MCKIFILQFFETIENLYESDNSDHNLYEEDTLEQLECESNNSWETISDNSFESEIDAIATISVLFYDNSTHGVVLNLIVCTCKILRDLIVRQGVNEN